MLRKIAFALMLMFACASCAWADYVPSYTGGGSGTDSGDALWIVTPGDLVRLRNSVNDSEDTEPAGRYYVLSKDIHITNSLWVAIGNQYSGNSFSGHFDGNGKTIHIQIRKLPDYDENLLSMDRALFGCISTAEASEESGDYAVKNLKVAGFAEGYNVAGIVSRLSSGIIEGCGVSADLSVTELGGEDEAEPSKINAGGIAAIITGGTIRSCDFSGNIYAEGSTFSPLAGGIVGAMTGGTIEDCTVKHYASISVQGGDEDNPPSAGGIVAYVNISDVYSDDEYDTVTGCVFEGGAITSEYYAGGITGYARGGQYTHNTVGDDTRISGAIVAGGIVGSLGSGGYVYSNDIQGGVISSDSRAAGGIVGLLELGYVDSNKSFAGVRGDASYKGGVIGEIHNHYGSSEKVTGNSYKGTNFGIGIDEHANLNVDTGCTRLDDDDLQLYFFTPKTLDSAMENESYSYTIELSQPAASTAVFTSLPSWMSHVPEGKYIKLTGIPTVTGEFSFTVEASYAYQTISRTFTVNVVPQLYIDGLDSTSANVGENVSISPSVNTRGYDISHSSFDWSIVSGEFPAGVSIDASDGKISGIVASSGTYSIAIQSTPENLSLTPASASMTIYVSPEFELDDDSTLPNAKAGRLYSHAISTNPSDMSDIPIVWSISSGSLPDGVILGVYTGELTGTPTESGAYTFTVLAEGGNFTAQKEFTLTVTPAISITTDSALPLAFTGEFYSQEILHDVPAGNSVTWQMNESSSGLPAGLSFDTGILAGIVSDDDSVVGDYGFNVRITAGGFTDSKDFTLKAVCFKFSPDIFPVVVVGAEYSHDLAQYLEISGVSEYLITWSADSLPSGISLDSDGVISGIPSVSGAYEFAVRVILSEDYFIEEQCSLTVYPVISVVDTSDFPERVKAGGKISYTFTTDSDTPENISWSYSGTLPDGLTLGNLTGELTGTPTTAGTYTFTVIAVNGVATATQEITLIISPAITITTDTTLPYALTGSEYSTTLEHDAPEGNTVTWAKLSGDIPDGLTLSADTGVISGVASEAGVYEFRIQATAGAFVASKDFTLRVIYFVISSDAELPGAVEGKEYSFDLIAEGGSAVWSSDTLPSWLTLSSDGYIYGTPDTAGDYEFTAWATSGDISLSKDFTITVYPQLSVSDVSDFPARVKAGGKISYTFTTDSDTPENISWSYSGTLPDGLTLGNLTGELTGTPTTAGTYTFTVIAVNGAATATQEITLIISPAITITTDTTLPYALTGSEYSTTLEHDAPEGNTVTWAKLSGDIPDGLTLSADTGVISGVASEAGVYEFRIQATAGAFTTSKDFTLEVIDFFISSDSQLPDASRGRIYSYQFTAHGLPETLVTWSADEDALPIGLTFYNTGLLSGTALIEGSYTFTVQATSGTFTARKTITLNVTTPITITTASPLPNAVKGVRYSLTLSHDIPAGNTPSWQVIAGTLPEGLSLGAETGIISGIPDSTGIYSFTLQLTAVKTASKDFTLSVLGISSSTDIKLPDAILGTRYSFQLSADVLSADSQSLTWSADARTLPAGLTLNTSGLLSGIPTRAGTSSFNVRAIIGDSISSDIKLTLTVKPSGTDSSGTSSTSGSSVNIITSKLSPAETGKEYSATLESEPSGASWTLSGGFLPTGLSLSEDGKISGIPTQTGSFVFRVRASYPSYDDGEKQLSIFTSQGSGNVSSSGGGGGGGCDSGMGTTALILSFMAAIVKRKH